VSATVTLPAPGKLNLFLRILGRREDGYHELQTLFQLVEYGDELQFEDIPGGEIQIAGDFGSLKPGENIVYRAADQLRGKMRITRGVRIQVTKRLPMGGGMGGGSSDAATTLVALNRIWETGLDQSELESMAAGLGADVPLFVRGRTAWGEGIGEKLEVMDLPRRWYLVVVPETPVSTGEIFSHNDLTRHSSPITIARFLSHGAENDCEKLVRRVSPEVDEVIVWLSHWGPARMTGTGSCVFLSFDDREGAEEIHSRLPGKWRGFVTKGINHSPLFLQSGEL
jgi:4-diphosphocytidyl-2-C-methyl-D-erythritol kinase